MISADPRPISARVAWALACALLAAALAGGVMIAIHHHGRAAALRRYPRPLPSPLPVGTVPAPRSSRTVALPAHGTLSGVVRVVSARYSAGLEEITLSARITGAKPHTEYTLTEFDCAGTTGYQPWAAGVTNAAGTGILSGHARMVSLTDEYWLYLSPASGSAGPGLHVSFTLGGQFAATPAGDQPCTNG
jgi:hypothetical protein